MISWAMMVFDMFINPLWCLLSWLAGQKIGPFALIGMLWKSGNLWKKWARYQVLRDTARNWILLARCYGGPFISCNDPKYHVFVYAEAMERLRLLRGRSGSPENRRRARVAPKEGLKA